MQCLFVVLDNNSDNGLRVMKRDFKEKGYITTLWADNLLYSLEFNEKAYAIGEETIKEMKNGIYIANNITNGNANINCIDNSIRNENIIKNAIELFKKC